MFCIAILSRAASHYTHALGIDTLADYLIQGVEMARHFTHFFKLKYEEIIMILNF